MHRFFDDGSWQWRSATVRHMKEIKHKAGRQKKMSGNYNRCQYQGNPWYTQCWTKNQHQHRTGRKCGRYHKYPLQKRYLDDPQNRYGNVDDQRVAIQTNQCQQTGRVLDFLIQQRDNIFKTFEPRPQQMKSVTSSSTSGFGATTNHFKDAHNPSGTKQMYIMMAVAAIDTKWKL